MKELSTEQRQIHGEGCDYPPEGLPICVACKDNLVHHVDEYFCYDCKDEIIYTGKYFDVFVASTTGVFIQSKFVDSIYVGIDLIEKNFKDLCHLLMLNPFRTKQESAEIFEIHKHLKGIL